ncbi:MAG: hypothetical protein AAGD00_01910 [Planctomycetota bacterium]
MPAHRAVLTLCIPFALSAAASGAWMSADHAGAIAAAIDESPVIATADTLAARAAAPSVERSDFGFEVIVAPAAFEVDETTPLLLPAFPTDETGTTLGVPAFDDSLARLF